jgi:protoporphyrinogen oxidase
MHENSLNVIIGGGPAGLGAAYGLEQQGNEFVLLEKRDDLGGHSSSFYFGNSIFEEGPHISFTKFKKVRELFDQKASGAVRVDKAIVLNYFEGKWLTHPVMANLGQLQQLGQEIYLSYLETLRDKVPVLTSYDDWLRSTYGDMATDYFFRPYTLKYWGLEPSQMSLDWVEGRFFPPNPEVVKRGMKEANLDAHYVSEFHYPLNGGFTSFFRPEKMTQSYKLKTEVSQIDLENSKVLFSNGQSISYGNLISSMPLPELVKKLGVNVPGEVREASGALKCSKLHLINIRISKYKGPKTHWFYVYDLGLYSTRVTIQTAIKFGCNSLDQEVDIQVEVYEREGLSIPSNLASIVVSELVGFGLFQNVDLIEYESRFIEYANVVFDHSRKHSLEIVQNYLESINIKSVGRFGSWEYLWSDESFLEGVAAVNLDLAETLKGR